MAETKDRPDSDFAAVWVDSQGRKLRKLPIYDAAHVRNALARFEQTTLPSKVRKQAMDKIKAAAKRHEVEASEASHEAAESSEHEAKESE